ncbi:MAG: hypothetical protein R8G33_07630 [Gammaproteobacteria bacterium]|nr:hypothetical protein [Gammaproteobacteria bacterium]
MTTPIIILILLTSPLFIAFIITKLTKTRLNIKKYACWGLGIAFVFFSVGHFVKTDGMIEMLPPLLPYRLFIIYLTGVIEVFIGIALFIPKFQINAAKMAIVVFVVFFSANIYAALNATGLGGHLWGPIYLLIRLPLQLILIAWAYFLCIKSHIKLSQQNDTSESST